MFIKVQESYQVDMTEKKLSTTHNTHNTKCTEERKNIKSYREKVQVTYAGRAIRITPGFLKEPRKAKGTGWMFYHP